MANKYFKVDRPEGVEVEADLLWEVGTKIYKDGQVVKWNGHVYPSLRAFQKEFTPWIEGEDRYHGDYFVTEFDAVSIDFNII